MEHTSSKTYGSCNFKYLEDKNKKTSSRHMAKDLKAKLKTRKTLLNM